MYVVFLFMFDRYASKSVLEVLNQHACVCVCVCVWCMCVYLHICFGLYV